MKARIDCPIEAADYEYTNIIIGVIMAIMSYYLNAYQHCIM
jgi:hypothetical protein